MLALFVGRDSLGGMLDTVLTERGGAPLHYLLAWAVVHLGGGLDALRLVSLACALASIPLIAALAARLVGPSARARCDRAGLARAGSSSSTRVFGRMYALFLLTATASFLALVARRWGWWAVATLAALAAHPYGALAAGRAARLPARLARAARAARGRLLVLAAALPALVRVLRARGPLRRGRRAEVRRWLRARGGRRPDLRLPPGLLAVVAVLALVGFTRVRDARARRLRAAAPGCSRSRWPQVTDASPESRHLIFLLPFVGRARRGGPAPPRGAGRPARRPRSSSFELAWAWHRTPELFEGESPRSGPGESRGGRVARRAPPARATSSTATTRSSWPPGSATGRFRARVVPRADAKLALEELDRRASRPRRLGRRGRSPRPRAREPPLRRADGRALARGDGLGRALPRAGRDRPGGDRPRDRARGAAALRALVALDGLAVAGRALERRAGPRGSARRRPDGAGGARSRSRPTRRARPRSANERRRSPCPSWSMGAL